MADPDTARDAAPSLLSTHLIWSWGSGGRKEPQRWKILDCEGKLWIGNPPWTSTCWVEMSRELSCDHQGLYGAASLRGIWFVFGAVISWSAGLQPFWYMSMQSQVYHRSHRLITGLVVHPKIVLHLNRFQWPEGCKLSSSQNSKTF